MIQVKLTDNEAILDSAYNIEIKVYSGGTQVIPTSAKISILRGGTTLVDQAESPEVAINVSSGTITYTSAAANQNLIYEGQVIFLEYTYDSVDREASKMYYVVKSPLVNDVIEADLKKEYPDLETHFWENTDVQTIIDFAWGEVKIDICNKGRRSDMVIDSNQIKPLTIQKFYEIAFKSFIKNPNDAWNLYYQAAEKRYNSLLKNLTILYDTDRNRTFDEKRNFSTITGYR